jgi:hypothetical protein
VVLVVPHALHVAGAAAALDDRDSLPGASGGPSRMLGSLWARNTVLTPGLYPAGLVVLALVGLPREPFMLVRMDRVDRDRASPGRRLHAPPLPGPPGAAAHGAGPGVVDPRLDRSARSGSAGLLLLGHALPRRVPQRGHAAAARRGHAAGLRGLRERFTLTPVVETTVPNRGDVWLEYYGDASQLRLGLCRIEGRR